MRFSCAKVIENLQEGKFCIEKLFEIVKIWETTHSSKHKLQSTSAMDVLNINSKISIHAYSLNHFLRNTHIIYSGAVKPMLFSIASNGIF